VKEWFAIIMGASLLVLMIPILYRIIMGPTGFDRILGANVIGTKTAVILVIIGTLFERVEMFVDFAIAYALLNFVGAIVVSRYFNRTVPLKEMENEQSKRRGGAKA
jgi:multicomponent Na+:H+ antiporter subunit F